MKSLSIICSPAYTQEKKYVLEVIFSEFLGIPYDVAFTGRTGVTELFFDAEKKIVLPDILFAVPEDQWLSRQSLPALPLRKRSMNDLGEDRFFSNTIPVIYGEAQAIPVNPESETIRFDIDLLGSIFFMLTRYEEISETHTDAFERYPASRSVAVKAGFLDRAIVNEYTDVLFALLKLLKAGISCIGRTYEVVLSHDVDIPLSVTSSSFLFVRSCLADLLLRRSPKLFLKRVKARWMAAVHKKFEYDPVFNFEYIMDCSERLKIKSHFYFIVRDGKGSIDGNYEITDDFYRNLLLHIHKRGHEIGFHPSYYTFCNKEKTTQEFNKLRNLCEELGIRQDRWGGRQHYLRWKNPDTWAIWDEMGADYDSSLGYEGATGFRTGTCYEHSAFDLKARRHLRLKEWPLVVMDISEFRKTRFSEILADIDKLSSVCKYFNGRFTLLYHNNYIISESQKREYNAILNKITQHT